MSARIFRFEFLATPFLAVTITVSLLLDLLKFLEGQFFPTFKNLNYSMFLARLFNHCLILYVSNMFVAYMKLHGHVYL